VSARRLLFARPAAMLVSAALTLGAILAAGAARADRIPAGWTGENMEVVGYTIMNGHPAFKITMTKAADR